MNRDSRTATFYGAVSAIAIAGALAAPGLARAQDFQLGTIVVTPNRTPTEASKVGSSVDKIDRADIEAQDLPAVTDYLNLVPGVDVTSPGGIGTESSLSIRGAPKRYVKTLYNGIDISDPTSTQVQTSYQYLLAGGVGDIEVLKGAQSTLYGADAIAGVIGISTLKGIEPGVTHIIEGEGGSHGTARGHYGLQAAGDEGSLALNVTGLRTDGISAAASGTERDAYDNITFDLSGEYRVNDNFSVFGSLLYIDATAEYDDAGTPPTDNPFNVNKSEQLAGRAGFNLDLMDGRLKNTFSMQAFQIDRGIESVSAFGPFNADYTGHRYKFDYQGSFEATDWLTLQYGADHERQRAQITDNYGTDTDEDFSDTGLWSQMILEPVENLVLTAGLRYDDHSAFGGHTTGRATASYLVEQTGTRLHGSIGTGFRAPSLYELYDPFAGNPDLQPETSVSFDAGIEQTFLDGRMVADVTYFMSEIDDLIAYSGLSYIQIPGTSKQQGVETSLTYAVNGWLDVGASYTYTESHDQTGARIPRVPLHTVGLLASAQPWEKWTLSGAAKVAVDTVDTGDFELDDYVLLNAKVAYKPTEDTEVYLRAENVLDQNYETARGFNTPGFSVFAGFRAKFGS